eukprot:SAG31_NODE_3855_length_3815_cov_12.889128_2_plen_67_part_00
MFRGADCRTTSASSGIGQPEGSDGGIDRSVGEKLRVLQHDQSTLLERQISGGDLDATRHSAGEPDF